MDRLAPSIVQETPDAQTVFFERTMVPHSYCHHLANHMRCKRCVFLIVKSLLAPMNLSVFQA